jgi:hypothetical protein
MDSFLIKFNKGRQWISVTVWEQHPTTFYKWAETRWGYFIERWTETENSTPRGGYFGELHLVKAGIREDTIAHEMFHVICEIIRARGVTLTGRNEEIYACILDELVRKFYKGYRKNEKGNQRKTL